MASVTATGSFTALSCSFKKNQVANRFSSLNSVSISFNGKSFQSLRMKQAPSFHVACAAKQDTVEKVCKIVKKQLALEENSTVTGESKFSALGADSLDTVEIVMALEEEFDISVEEESAQSIDTVQDAADLIEELVKNKA